jgi:hypothetical protein
MYWNGFGGRAHRWSYQVFVGPIHAGRQVQHKCERKDCINPRHLYLGTQIAVRFSGGDPELTPQEFERLCNELADLDRKASLSDFRRKQIEAQLRGTIRRDERRTHIKKYRSDLRQASPSLDGQASIVAPVIQIGKPKWGWQCETITLLRMKLSGGLSGWKG